MVILPPVGLGNPGLWLAVETSPLGRRRGAQHHRQVIQPGWKFEGRLCKQAIDFRPAVYAKCLKSRKQALCGNEKAFWPDVVEGESDVAAETDAPVDQDGSDVTLEIDNIVKAKLIPDYEKILAGHKTK